MPRPVALPEDTLVSHVIFPSWQRLNEESSQVRHRARSRVLRAFLPSTSATSRKHLHRRIRARTRLSSTPLPRCSLFSFIYQRETFESRNLGIPTSLLSSPLLLRTKLSYGFPYGCPSNLLFIQTRSSLPSIEIKRESTWVSSWD